MKKILFLSLLVGLAAFGCNKSTKQNNNGTTANTAAPGSNQNLPAPKPLTFTSGDTYGLFPIQSYDTTNGYTAVVKYSDDGIIDSGPYAGYHRIAATHSENSPGGPDYLIFATKDYQKFVMDSVTSAYLDNAQNSSTPVVDKSKLIAVAPIPVDQPPTIDLGAFILVRQGFTFDPISPDAARLGSKIPGLNYFANPRVPIDPSTQTDPNYKQLYEAQNQYFASTTDVYVQDNSGLAFDYFMVSKEQYNAGLTAAANDKNTPPLNETYYIRSGSFYGSNDLTATNNAQLDSTYGVLLPGGCSNVGLSYILKGVSDSDLVEVGTVKSSGDPIYTLKDQNSALDKEEYFAKITSLGDQYGIANKNATPPSYQAYVSTNPVLIIKDPFGRLLGLGETQYLLLGGCGKPVVYLYPTKPTDVTVKFVKPISFAADIPTYNGQWHVLANPDGELKDLQPQATDCSAINYSLAGSGYARSACASGIYPYLYWSGATIGGYPQPTGGWVVSAADLKNFMASTLTSVGLNSKEQSDMSSYWVPQMLATGDPYYKISFVQTADMNSFIPMQVTPRPDTTFRIFLDWTPLVSKPVRDPQPQTLQKLVRKGFTLVEWGGVHP